MKTTIFKLNKPFGYLSQFANNQTRRKNKKLLGELFDFPDGSMAIGRLDEDSEGLLLLLQPSFPERPRKIRDSRHWPTSWISITLTEGKFRQVRKMTAAVGFPTLRLVRVRIGDILLENMRPGEVQEIDLP